MPSRGDIVIYDHIIPAANQPANSPWYDHIGIVLSVDVAKLIKEVLIIKKSGEIIGWLRFGYFWDEHPFMNMLCGRYEVRKVGMQG